MRKSRKHHPVQDEVIRVLSKADGNWMTTSEFAKAIYGEDYHRHVNSVWGALNGVNIRDSVEEWRGRPTRWKLRDRQ